MLDEYHVDRSQKENRCDQMPRQFRQKSDVPNVNRKQIAIFLNKLGNGSFVIFIFRFSEINQYSF